MKAKPIPDVGYLLQCFKYQDGALYWLERPLEHFKNKQTHAMWNAKFSTKRAGRQMSGKVPYWQIGLDGKRYLEHRMIAAIHGISVDNNIDHRDRNGANNLPSNLRPATQSQNTKNNSGWKKKVSPCGVHQRSNGTWVAYVRAVGRLKHLGTFPTMEEALVVRRQAERTYYGSFAAERLVTS